jgi:O-antigen/teichoic acid export membrane protein
MKKQLLTSSVFRLLENIIMVTIALLMTPFFISTLGTNDYGLWLLTLSILGWFNIVDLGFPAAVQRHITIALEKKNSIEINTVFSTSIALFGSLGGLSALGLLILAQYPTFLGVNEASTLTFTTALMMLALKVIWDFLMNAFNGFFAGMLRFDIDANIATSNNIFKALLVFLLIPEMQIMGAVAATLIADFTSNILKIIYAKKLFPPLKFKTDLVSIVELKSLFKFSKHVIAGGIARVISTKSDPILVTRLFELTLVPIYSIANRLCTLVEGFASSVSGIFQPVFTRMMAREENMEAMFNEISLINIAVYSVLYQLLLVFGGLFIVLWVGDAFFDSILLMNILVFSFLCRALSWSIKGVLLAQANHKLLAPTNLFAALVNIACSIFLSQYIGIIGIAVGTAIGFFISDVLLGLMQLKRYNDFNIFPVIRAFILSVLLTYAFGYVGKELIVQNLEQSWFMLVISGIIIFPFILLANWLVLFDKNLKQKSISFLATKLPFLKTSE